MLRDINRTLLTHLATGPGAASLLRSGRPQLISATEAFFNARTDIRRLHASQDVAEVILMRNDLDDLVEIRDIVAKQELRRQIRYPKQKDHTAHTVYLYLLGLWFHDNLPQISESIERECATHSMSDPLSYFLLHWTYASLLHDMGYAFHNLDDDTKEDRRRIDDVFSWKWLDRHCNTKTEEGKEALRKAHDAWIDKYSNMMPLGTEMYSNDEYQQVLQRLASAPWLSAIIHGSANDLFDVLDETSSLRGYAEEVATQGYGGKGQCVDHAVSSGLFLFQYTSYWYWLMHHVEENSPDFYNEITGNFNYKTENLTTDFVHACKAVAFHNIQPTTMTGKSIISHLTLQEAPVIFLAILCDELQRWDRAPAGSDDLDHYRVFAQHSLESTDIELRCDGTSLYRTARFVIHHPPTTEDKGKLQKDLRETLSQRLPEYTKAVTVDVR
jgi:hypothetical protein